MKIFKAYFHWLLSITKLQNLKAIHNPRHRQLGQHRVVINHKTTKFESNSQLHTPNLLWRICCYQSQNYKIWKQFTTRDVRTRKQLLLLSITKLQNLKAIHNRCILHLENFVVINHKTTKFESNSQLAFSAIVTRLRCYQSQNYKIWKQFTTVCIVSRFNG